MENLIYWDNVAVGREVAGKIYWFPSVTPEAIKALS